MIPLQLTVRILKRRAVETMRSVLAGNVVALHQTDCAMIMSVDENRCCRSAPPVLISLQFALQRLRKTQLRRRSACSEERLLSVKRCLSSSDASRNAIIFKA